MTDVHPVWKERQQVTSDTGVAVMLTTTLDETPEDVDVLFVPGGPGRSQWTRRYSHSSPTVPFLADRASRARYVASVCTGSIIRRAAGLLKGYRAGCHRAARSLLSEFGAEPDEARVVVDRNRITGGGVTAGVDLGLTLVAEMLGEETADLTQLWMEYDPFPRSTAGARAPPLLLRWRPRGSLSRVWNRRSRGPLLVRLGDIACQVAHVDSTTYDGARPDTPDRP